MYRPSHQDGVHPTTVQKPPIDIPGPLGTFPTVWPPCSAGCAPSPCITRHLPCLRDVTLHRPPAESAALPEHRLRPNILRQLLPGVTVGQTAQHEIPLRSLTIAAHICACGAAGLESARRSRTRPVSVRARYLSEPSRIRRRALERRKPSNWCMSACSACEPRQAAVSCGAVRQSGRLCYPGSVTLSPADPPRSPAGRPECQLGLNVGRIPDVRPVDRLGFHGSCLSGQPGIPRTCT